jgi:hypothetical protein
VYPIVLKEFQRVNSHPFHEHCTCFGQRVVILEEGVMQPAFNTNACEMTWNETLPVYGQVIVAEKFCIMMGDKTIFPTLTA